MSGYSPKANPEVNEAKLVKKAVEARSLAYAPYSNFRVGAALLAKDGRIFCGCNVENAAYGLTVCAERVALFKAVAEGVREFLALAVACGTEPCAPCGACRQVLYEFASDLLVIMADGEGENFRVARLSELLPHSFGPHALRAPSSTKGKTDLWI